MNNAQKIIFIIMISFYNNNVGILSFILLKLNSLSFFKQIKQKFLIRKFNNQFPNALSLKNIFNDNKIENAYKTFNGTERLNKQFTNGNVCGIAGAFFIKCYLQGLTINEFAENINKFTVNIKKSIDWGDMPTIQMFIVNECDMENYLNKENSLTPEDYTQMNTLSLSAKINYICNKIKNNFHTIIHLNYQMHYIHLIKFNDIIQLINTEQNEKEIIQQIHNNTLNINQKNYYDNLYLSEMTTVMPLLPFNKTNPKY